MDPSFGARVDVGWTRGAGQGKKYPPHPLPPRTPGKYLLPKMPEERYICCRQVPHASSHRAGVFPSNRVRSRPRPLMIPPRNLPHLARFPSTTPPSSTHRTTITALTAGRNATTHRGGSGDDVVGRRGGKGWGYVRTPYFATASLPGGARPWGGKQKKTRPDTRPAADLLGLDGDAVGSRRDDSVGHVEEQAVFHHAHGLKHLPRARRQPSRSRRGQTDETGRKL